MTAIIRAALGVLRNEAPGWGSLLATLFVLIICLVGVPLSWLVWKLTGK